MPPQRRQTSSTVAVRGRRHRHRRADLGVTGLRQADAGTLPLWSPSVAGGSESSSSSELHAARPNKRLTNDTRAPPNIADSTTPQHAGTTSITAQVTRVPQVPPSTASATFGSHPPSVSRRYDASTRQDSARIVARPPSYSSRHRQQRWHITVVNVMLRGTKNALTAVMLPGYLGQRQHGAVWHMVQDYATC